MDETAAGLTARAFWHDLPRPGKWMLATTAIQLLGRGLTLPFTVIYLNEIRGISLDVAGLLMAWIGVAGLMSTGPGGAAIDRFGARVVCLAGSSLQLAGVALLALSTTVPMAWMAMTLMGLASITWPAFNALVASIVSGPARQTYFGISFALVNAGIGLGGLSAGLYVDVHRPQTFTTIYLLDAASMLIPIGLMLGPLRHVHARAERPDDVTAQSSTYLAILRQPVVLWLMLLTLAANLIGYGQIEAGVPGFARYASQVSTRVIGWAFAMNTALIVFAQFFVLRRIDGHRRTRVLMVMAALWACAWLLLGSTVLDPASAYAVAGVVGFMAVFGLGETLLQPSLPAITNDLAPPHLRGRYNAVSQAAFMAGSMTGPVIAGFLLRHHWHGVFIGLIVTLCLGMILISRRLEQLVTPEVNGVSG